MMTIPARSRHFLLHERDQDDLVVGFHTPCGYEPRTHANGNLRDSYVTIAYPETVTCPTCLTHMRGRHGRD